jgi:hypothetical protein
MKYTQKEVQLNIEFLTNKMELLKLQRTEITQSINSLKKTNNRVAGVGFKSNKTVLNGITKNRGFSR